MNRFREADMKTRIAEACAILLFLYVCAVTGCDIENFTDCAFRAMDNENQLSRGYYIEANYTKVRICKIFFEYLDECFKRRNAPCSQELFNNLVSGLPSVKIDYWLTCPIRPAVFKLTRFCKMQVETNQKKRRVSDRWMFQNRLGDQYICFCVAFAEYGRVKCHFAGCIDDDGTKWSAGSRRQIRHQPCTCDQDREISLLTHPGVKTHDWHCTRCLRNCLKCRPDRDLTCVECKKPLYRREYRTPSKVHVACIKTCSPHGVTYYTPVKRCEPPNWVNTPAPEITVHIIPDVSTITRPLGVSLAVQCMVSMWTGGGIPPLQWFSNHGILIQHVGASERVRVLQMADRLALFIKYTIASDKGQWKCNLKGRDAFWIVRIDITEEISFKNTQTTQWLGSGTTDIIYCEVHAHTKPQVTWYFKGKKLVSDGHTMLVGDNVQIFNIEKSDGGIYKCEATILHPKFVQKSIDINVTVFESKKFSKSFAALGEMYEKLEVVAVALSIVINIRFL